MSGRPGDSGPGRTAPFFDQGIFLLHLNRGKEELRLGHYEEARRELEDARRFRAQEPEVLANLAFSLFHLGQYEDAEKITREVLGSFPTSVPLLFNLGLILFKAGRHAEARDPLERVLQLSPSHRKAHLTLGLVYRKLGLSTEASGHFRSAGAERRPGGEEDDTLSRLARAAKGGASPGGGDRELATSPIVKAEHFPGPAAPAPAEKGPPPAAAPPSVLPHGPFLADAGGLLAAETAGGVIVRKDAITGRRGFPVLDEAPQLSETFGPLFLRAGGSGTVLLLDRGRRPHVMTPEGGFLSVDPVRTLAFEASLEYREDPSFEFFRLQVHPFLKLLGEGQVVLAVGAEPSRLDVRTAEPLTIAADTVVAYSGELEVEWIDPGPRFPEFGSRPLYRFTGTGAVFVDAG